MSGAVAVLALIVTALALWGIEGEYAEAAPEGDAQKMPFKAALASVWEEPEALAQWTSKKAIVCLPSSAVKVAVWQAEQ